MRLIAVAALVVLSGCTERAHTPSPQAGIGNGYPSTGRQEPDMSWVEISKERAERREAALEARRAQLTSASDIGSLEDARAYFRPDVASQVLWTRPPADGKYHEMVTIISHDTQWGLLSWWPDITVRTGTYSHHIAVGALFPNPAYVQPGFVLGGTITAIGRYTGYRDIRLANGTPLTVPVFEDAYIFRH